MDSHDLLDAFEQLEEDDTFLLNGREQRELMLLYSDTSHGLFTCVDSAARTVPGVEEPFRQVYTFDIPVAADVEAVFMWVSDKDDVHGFKSAQDIDVSSCNMTQVGDVMPSDFTF
jgi:hypothetical protein